MLYTSRKRLPFKTEDYNQAWTGAMHYSLTLLLLTNLKWRLPLPTELSRIHASHTTLILPLLCSTKIKMVFVVKLGSFLVLRTGTIAKCRIK